MRSWSQRHDRPPDPTPRPAAGIRDRLVHRPASPAAAALPAHRAARAAAASGFDPRLLAPPPRRLPARMGGQMTTEPAAILQALVERINPLTPAEAARDLIETLTGLVSQAADRRRIYAIDLA